MSRRTKISLLWDLYKWAQAYQKMVRITGIFMWPVARPERAMPGDDESRPYQEIYGKQPEQSLFSRKICSSAGLVYCILPPRVCQAKIRIYISDSILFLSARCTELSSSLPFLFFSAKSSIDKKEHCMLRLSLLLTERWPSG